MEPKRASETPHCSRCLHYCVTHDPARPYGCRAFDIKSAKLPMTEVREASGAECRAFEPRTITERTP